MNLYILTMKLLHLFDNIKYINKLLVNVRS